MGCGASKHQSATANAGHTSSEFSLHDVVGPSIAEDGHGEHTNSSKQQSSSTKTPDRSLVVLSPPLNEQVLEEYFEEEIGDRRRRADDWLAQCNCPQSIIGTYIDTSQLQPSDEVEKSGDKLNGSTGSCASWTSLNADEVSALSASRRAHSTMSPVPEMSGDD
jgi:hypothetical protein